MTGFINKRGHDEFDSTSLISVFGNILSLMLYWKISPTPTNISVAFNVLFHFNQSF